MEWNKSATNVGLKRNVKTFTHIKLEASTQLKPCMSMKEFRVVELK